jgi:hypothetical protein
VTRGAGASRLLRLRRPRGDIGDSGDGHSISYFGGAAQWPASSDTDHVI